MFFHHLNLADLNGWSHEWVTGSYVLYAGAATLTSLAAGQLVDRFGAIKVVPITLIPQGIGLIFIALFDSSMALLPYLALIGITTGIAHTRGAALWAERDGGGADGGGARIGAEARAPRHLLERRRVP